MRNPNGYGGVVKLSGNRRKPYMAYFTSIESEGTITQEDNKKLLEARLEALKRTSDSDVMWELAIKILTETETDIHTYLIEACEKSINKAVYKGKQVKHPLGYFVTRKEANICLAEYNKGRINTDALNMTFEDAFYGALESVSGSAREYWKIEKCEAVRSKLLRRITLADLQSVMDSVSGTSRSTQSHLLTVIQSVFRYGMQHDAITKDYSQYLKVGETSEVKEKHPYEKGEISAMWEAGEVHKLLMIYTGMRLGEYLNLVPQDIDIDKRIIHIRGTKTKNADRLVPIHKDILPLMADFKPAEISRRTLQRSFGEGHTAHDCRHTFITYCHSMEPALLKSIVGHAGGLTIDTYTHADMLVKEMAEAIDLIEFKE